MKSKAIKGTQRFQKVHGMTMTPTWKTWRQMIYRCSNKNYKRYSDYGGRGISVCDRWLDFVNFLEDMGERPQGSSIDRINNNGNYEPSNCRWADRSTQQSNSRQAIRCRVNGIEYPTVGAAARALGLHRATIQWRFNHGVEGYERL